MRRLQMFTVAAVAVLLAASTNICHAQYASIGIAAETAEEADASPALVEKALLERINAYRVARRLPQLRLDERMSAVARGHSANMASGRTVFGHQAFPHRLNALGRPYRSAAENIAANQGYDDPGAQAVQDWLGSPMHRENLEGRFALTGIGVAQSPDGEYFFTQIFLR